MVTSRSNNNAVVVLWAHVGRAGALKCVPVWESQSCVRLRRLPISEFVWPELTQLMLYLKVDLLVLSLSESTNS